MKSENKGIGIILRTGDDGKPFSLPTYRVRWKDGSESYHIFGEIFRSDGKPEQLEVGDEVVRTVDLPTDTKLVPCPKEELAAEGSKIEMAILKCESCKKTFYIADEILEYEIIHRIKFCPYCGLRN